MTFRGLTDSFAPPLARARAHTPARTPARAPTHVRRVLATLSAGAMAAVATLAPPALAQSYCASDGQRAPVALLERFINADCDACWASPDTPQPRTGELAIDWIVPGGKGEDAPLSAAATRDAAARLQALKLPRPAEASTARLTPARDARRTLRVAHGLPFAGYIAASIELKPAGATPAGPLTAWLALVETIPAGTEGTPVTRNLVRNVLESAWDGRSLLLKYEQKRFFESRPMSIPAGANPERLRVVGWVQDTKGRITAIAQSRCAPTGQNP